MQMLTSNNSLDILKHGTALLSHYYPEQEARSLVLWCLEEATMQGRAQLMAGQELRPAQAQAITQALERLTKYEPVQYIFEHTWFHGLHLKVGPGVLIPRPETEEMVAAVLSKHSPESIADVLDVGTGSGCIGVTLAKAWPQAAVTGIDISAEALLIAAHNAAEQHTGNFCTLQADALDTDSLVFPKSFDLIVSNPPYVRQSEKAIMHENVLNYEPHQALFVADQQALIFYEAIARLSQRWLKPKGAIWVEINEALGPETAAVFQQHFPEAQIWLHADMHGKMRFLECLR